MRSFVRKEPVEDNSGVTRAKRPRRECGGGAVLYVGYSVGKVIGMVPHGVVLDPNVLRSTQKMTDHIEAWNFAGSQDIVMDDAEILKSGRLPGLTIVKDNLHRHTWHVPCEGADDGFGLFKWSKVIQGEITLKRDDVAAEIRAFLVSGCTDRMHVLAAEPGHASGIIHENYVTLLPEDGMERAHAIAESMSAADAAQDEFVSDTSNILRPLHILRSGPNAMTKSKPLRNGTAWSKDSTAHDRMSKLKLRRPGALSAISEPQAYLDVLVKDPDSVPAYTTDVACIRTMQNCAFTKVDRHAFKDLITWMKK